ncbi:FAD-dependent oxidoreductase [Chitinophaga sp. SYP-B3965]|uniref:FAD-dependent oxidoreductase n=1 Tax=Chitinophaga sp. SYP-B3965 TaxID=2663120 RepID=UPI001299FFA1|nr:FAD-dependent oxidoreductase [Chitinophaga sp. SYP-B3965]MRG43848.1 FAD-dependent oxidoreductase [Chitinophaga sp. SYP-B3965]
MRALFIALLVLSNTVATGKEKVDVCIYGGTSAGVIAAYTAKMMGRSVLLLEPGKHLGGLTSGGLGYTDIGNKYAIRGLSLDFYRRIGQHYGKFEQWIFEPHVAESLFQDYISRAKVKVMYDQRITNATKVQQKITSITLEGGLEVEAKMYIDCSYEGDLMAKAGVSFTIGREANSQYGEKYNGVQLADGHQFPDGIDPYKTPGDPKSGLLWGISPAVLEATGSGDKCVQAYNYRICLSNDPANMVPITKPDNYDPAHYELLARLIKAQPEKLTFSDYFIVSRMPNNKTDINNRNGFSTDMIGMNYDYPAADYATRAKIIKEHEDYTKGLLYFMGNDPRVPEQIRTSISKWGYPKDEYTDNGNWSPQLYIREARRLVGQYVMTQANCTGKTVVTDGVGMAAYTMDSHNTQRLVVNGMVKNEGNVEVGGFPPYPVGYAALIPKTEDCSNLLVPVCLSATHIAYGSIRMEPVFMALAQSTAIAADLAITNKQTVQQVNADKIREVLQKNPLANGAQPDLLIDNRDSLAVTKQGVWRRGGGGSYGPDMLSIDSGATDLRTVQFTARGLKAGKYNAYIYYPHLKKNTDITTIKVQNKTVLIKKADVTVQGQTSGEWVSIGSYTIKKGENPVVQFSNENINGTVVADAVLWVPER